MERDTKSSKQDKRHMKPQLEVQHEIGFQNLVNACTFTLRPISKDFPQLCQSKPYINLKFRKS